MQSSYVRTVLLLSSFPGWIVRTKRKQAAKKLEGVGGGGGGGAQ